MIVLIITGFTKNSEKIQEGVWRARVRRQLEVALLLGLLSLLSGCMGTMPPPVERGTPGIPPSPTSAYPWTDESAVVNGVCFESAYDAAGQVFVLRSAEDHIHFYELVDNSQLCRHPVARYPFEFSEGRILAGLWSYGRGCTARHELVSFSRDDTSRAFTIQLRFITEGDCDYELLRPFWVGLDKVADYTIEIQVE